MPDYIVTDSILEDRMAGLSPAELEDAAAKARASAEQATRTVATVTPRLNALEARDGLDAGSLTDGSVASAVLQPDTEARAAVESVVRSTPGMTVGQGVARKLRGKKVAFVMRHDDIQASALDYLPLYAELGVQASWYVVYNRMGTRGDGDMWHATADDVRRIHAAGHEIGSHTMDHFYFDGSTEAQRRQQLQDSKASLEAMLGGTYVCETFAYPGNQNGNSFEVLDYYLMSTTGVRQSSHSGATNTAGTIDLAAHLAEYPAPILGATPAETKVKAQAWIDAQKDRPGVTVYTLQTHNLREFPLAHMRALLEVIQDDDAATTLTLREVAHYVREYSTTMDGRLYHGTMAEVGAAMRFNTAQVAQAGVSVDRLNAGSAFEVKEKGTRVSTFDKFFAMLTPGTSRLERGHNLQFYTEDNTQSARFFMTGLGNLQFSITGTGILQALAGIQIRKLGRVLQAVNPSSGEVTFEADTDRRTMFLYPRTDFPTGTARVGELCLVSNILYVCVGGGTPGTWAKVGA